MRLETSQETQYVQSGGDTAKERTGACCVVVAGGFESGKKRGSELLEFLWCVDCDVDFSANCFKTAVKRNECVLVLRVMILMC